MELKQDLIILFFQIKLSTSNLNELAYYIDNITDADFIENEYKLNFSSEVLKNYKSFDMLIYAKEIPYGMHFLSEIISSYLPILFK